MNKEKIGFIKRHAGTIVKFALIAVGALVLAGFSGNDSAPKELTEGQELDLSNALESVRWSFGEEIESTYVGDGVITFYLSNGETEYVNFYYDGGTWFASSFDSEAVSSAVESILGELNY